MKKVLIGIGALVVGLAAVVFVTQFNAEEAGEFKSASSGEASAKAGSCCPIPSEKDRVETAAYKCESCGTKYEKAGTCCGSPTKKVN